MANEECLVQWIGRTMIWFSHFFQSDGACTWIIYISESHFWKTALEITTAQNHRRIMSGLWPQSTSPCSFRFLISDMGKEQGKEQKKTTLNMVILFLFYFWIWICIPQVHHQLATYLSTTQSKLIGWSISHTYLSISGKKKTTNYSDR